MFTSLIARRWSHVDFYLNYFFFFFFLGLKTKDTGNASDSHFFFVIAKYEYKSKYFRSKVAIQKIKTEQTAREIILMAF